MAKKKALRPSRLLNTPQSVKTPEQAPEAPKSFFLALPPEIRARIYGYAMGGNEVHVDCRDVAPQAMEYRRSNLQLVCQLREYKTEVTHDELVTLYTKDAAAGGLSLRTCRLLTESNRSIHLSRTEAITPNLCLPLLQTCRLVHWEAALIPFSANRFVLEVSDPVNYQLFLDSLMPSQRAAIRSLRLIFNDFYHALPEAFALSIPKVTDLATSMPGDINNSEIRTKSLWEMVQNLQRWPLKRVSVIACPGIFIARSEVRPPRSAGEIRSLAGVAMEIERRLLLEWDEEAFRRGVVDKREATARWKEEVAEERLEERKEVAKGRGLRPRK